MSILETVLAIALLLSASAVLVHLGVMATRANLAALAVTRATLLAADRAETLASETRAAGAAGLPLSPADALSANHAGYSDFFDVRGGALGPGPTAPPGAAFVRRWSIHSLPGGTGGARLMRVAVLPWPQGALIGPADSHRIEMVHLVLVGAGL